MVAFEGRPRGNRFAGKPFADFGARRAHGADAALRAARAAFIGGAASTSDVLAGSRYRDPALRHDGELVRDVLRKRRRGVLARTANRFGADTVFVIDTYDTREGALASARVSAGFLFKASGWQGCGMTQETWWRPPGIRPGKSWMLRASNTSRIFASGDLDDGRSPRSLRVAPESTASALVRAWRPARMRLRCPA